MTEIAVIFSNKNLTNTTVTEKKSKQTNMLLKNYTCLTDWIWNCCNFFQIKILPTLLWQKTIRTNISAFEGLNLFQWLNLKLLSFFSKENLTHITVTVEKSKQTNLLLKLNLFDWLNLKLLSFFSNKNLTHITVTEKKSKQTNLLLKNQTYLND